ncbi:hypothetical protein, partial [Pseudovibrio sp. Ad13]|uniref:hypothetical protein n=1 Tax=Pseudovibrio sp. Ad13 TaxID=989396 RepID=UPI0019D3303C
MKIFTTVVAGLFHAQVTVEDRANAPGRAFAAHATQHRFTGIPILMGIHLSLPFPSRKSNGAHVLFMFASAYFSFLTGVNLLACCCFLL